MSFSSFIRSTSLDGIEKVQADGESPLDRFDAIQDQIARFAGPVLVQLFCEPLISEGNGTAPTTISWYAAHEGEAVPLTALDTTERSAAEALLRARIDALQPVISAAPDGNLIAAALYVVDAADVFVVGGEPVLTNWGLMPDGAQVSLTKRKAAFAAGLGAFGLMLSAPPLSAQDFSAWRAALPGAEAQTPKELDPTGDANAEPRGIGSDSAHDASATVVTGLPWYRRAWAPALFAVLLTALVLIVLLIPGVLIAPPPPALAAMDNQARLLEDSNRALEDRLAQLQRAAELGVCTAEGNFDVELPPVADPEPTDPTVEEPTPQETSSQPRPADDEGGSAQESLLPPPLENIQLPDTQRAGGDPRSFLELVDLSTVLILVPGEDNASVGTGFFVTPSLIVTNDHVIDRAAGGPILVTSEALGEVVPVDLVARTGTSEDTKVDFALLRGDFSPDQPAYQIAEDVTRLAHVVAAGFPLVVVSEDARFQRLVQQGDASGAPSASTTRGVVTSVQNQAEDGTSVIAHDAEINQGNSGGPLLDTCGRVVGVNTYLLRNETTSAVARFALHGAELRAFLDGNNVPANYASGPCVPAVNAPASMPAVTPAAIDQETHVAPVPVPTETSTELSEDAEAPVQPQEVTTSESAATESSIASQDTAAEPTQATAPTDEAPVRVPRSRVVNSRDSGLPDGVIGDMGLAPE